LCAAIALLNAVIMGNRFRNSGAWWPAGTMFVASTVSIVSLAYAGFAGGGRKDV
jgi:hypothetical protein